MWAKRCTVNIEGVDESGIAVRRLWGWGGDEKLEVEEGFIQVKEESLVPEGSDEI